MMTLRDRQGLSRNTFRQYIQSLCSIPPTAQMHQHCKAQAKRAIREGCDLPNCLDSLVIHSAAALQAQACQVLQAYKLTQPFTGHLQGNMTKSEPAIKYSWKHSSNDLCTVGSYI